MPWTEQRKLESLLRLPWSIVPETTPEGDRLLRCGEIPAVVGSGGTDEELEADFWECLRASLECFLHFGDPFPLPPGAKLPWERSTDPSSVTRMHLSQSGEAWEVRATTALSSPVREPQPV